MGNNDIEIFRIANFSDGSNIIINKALKLAKAYNCTEMYDCHVFMAILGKSDIGKKLLELMGIPFSDIANTYKSLAASGYFINNEIHGDINSENDFPNGLFSINLTHLLSYLNTRAILNDEEATVLDILEALLTLMHADFLDFLEACGLSFDDYCNAVIELKYAVEENEVKPDEVVMDSEATVVREMFEVARESVKYFEDGVLNQDETDGCHNKKENNLDIPNELALFVEDLNTTLKNKDEKRFDVKSYTDEIIEVLNRKLKANPCLVGHPGVGKTTIVHSLVDRIINGDVPDNLKDSKVFYVNGSLLSAGTKYRGDFEARILKLLTWAKNEKIILFLDEIHTFIESGHSDSPVTAGNMIKKYLSEGSIKIIGATTYSEYHKYIEGDSAFSRRIEKVDIKEPTIEQTINIIKHNASVYERYHGVNIPENIIENAVKLSTRYMKDKYLPDKAYTILDQASVKTKLRGNRTVKESDLLSVVSKLSGVNVNRLNKNESKQLLNLEKTLSRNLIGQESAVKTVAKAIRRSKSGVREANKPIASFLFVGPTGVGKTELCKVLSKEIGIGKDAFIRVDMSEFSEKHSISKLIGTAPGYIGYKEGGQLLEKVKNNPYSVILFDEIEKAHKDIFNTFLQLLDDGRLTSGSGEVVDFTNCIIVMTSNAGYGLGDKKLNTIGFNNTDDILDDHSKEKIAKKALEDTFAPEFLNRIDNIVIFDSLDKEHSIEITKLMLDRLSSRLADKNIKVTFSKQLIESIVTKGFSDKYGARNLRREIQDTIEDNLSDAILAGTIKNGDIAVISWNNNKIMINKKEEK